MSLKKEVLRLYREGKISEGVVKHAYAQNQKIKQNVELTKKANLIGLRAKLFGVEPDLKKLASWTENVPKAIAGTAASALTFMGLDAIKDMYDRYQMAKQFNSSYDTMMENNPDLIDNEPLVREHFEVLKQFAPAMAAQPTVAAGYVSQAMEMGRLVPADMVKNLAQTQEIHMKGRNPGLAGTMVGKAVEQVPDVILRLNELGK